jgi:hypothetical protein
MRIEWENGIAYRKAIERVFHDTLAVRLGIDKYNYRMSTRWNNNGNSLVLVSIWCVLLRLAVGLGRNFPLSLPL